MCRPIKVNQIYKKLSPLLEQLPAEPKDKLNRVINLIDGYIWCTRGSDLEDDYSIRDEEDFEGFESELRTLLNESEAATCSPSV